MTSARSPDRRPRANCIPARRFFLAVTLARFGRRERAKAIPVLPRRTGSLDVRLRRPERRDGRGAEKNLEQAGRTSDKYLPNPRRSTSVFVRRDLGPVESALRSSDRTAATHLNEQPRCDERQAAVLSVEAVVVGVERKVVQVEEPETKNTCVTTCSALGCVT